MGGKRMGKTKQALILAGFAGALAAALAWETRALFPKAGEEPEEVAGDFRPIRFILPEPPVTQFATKSVREAWNLLDPEALVLGVTVNGASRAYPLDGFVTEPGRKIFNDSLGGQAIAASF